MELELGIDTTFMCTIAALVLYNVKTATVKYIGTTSTAGICMSVCTTYWYTYKARFISRFSELLDTIQNLANERVFVWEVKQPLTLDSRFL